MWRAWQERSLQETDATLPAVFRILVSLQCGWEAWRWWRDDLLTERVIAPWMQLHYTFFEWVRTPQGLVPHVYLWVLMAFAIATGLGWRTRWTALCLTLLWWYWFLIDATNYSDHGYLLGVLSALLVWLPVNRAASVDRLLGRETRSTVPGWTITVIHAQLALVHLFFALGLLNSDWLSGAPLLEWLRVSASDPGTLRSWSEGSVRLLAVGIPVGLLLATAGLIWNRTRLIACLLLVAWHVCDGLALGIGISPFFQAQLMLLFLPAAWWNRVSAVALAVLRRTPGVPLLWKGLCQAGWIIDRCVSWFDEAPGQAAAKTAETAPKVTSFVPEAKGQRRGNTQPAGLPLRMQVVLAVWALIQMGLPLRHVVLAQPADWSDLGTTFAWRGLNHIKQCYMTISVIQPSQEFRWPLEPTDEFPVPMAILFTEAELEKLQLTEGGLRDLIAGPAETLDARIAAIGIAPETADRVMRGYEATLNLRLTDHQYQVIVQRPELLRQYAQQISRVLGRLTGEELAVNAEVSASYNYRPAQILVDGELDLAAYQSFQQLAPHIPNLRTALPTGETRVAAAQAWFQQLQRDQELNFEVVSAKNVRPGEPVKLPAITEEDERWFQELMQSSAERQQ